MYKGKCPAAELRVDLLIEGLVIMECKAAREDNPVFEAQTLTCFPPARSETRIGHQLRKTACQRRYPSCGEWSMKFIEQLLATTFAPLRLCVSSCLLRLFSLIRRERAAQAIHTQGRHGLPRSGWTRRSRKRRRLLRSRALRECFSKMDGSGASCVPEHSRLV